MTKSFPALSQVKSISSLDDTPSLSTHRYSTISAIVTDIRNIVSDHEPEEIAVKPPRTFHLPTSLLQPDISVIRVGTNRFPNHLTAQTLEEETEPDTPEETCSESYEVTYQVDRQSLKSSEHEEEEKEQRATTSRPTLSSRLHSPSTPFFRHATEDSSRSIGIQRSGHSLDPLVTGCSS